MSAQGWYPDPFGVHTDRWFSDGHPTSLVRDGDRESNDPPPIGQAGEPLLPSRALVRRPRVASAVDAQPVAPKFEEMVEFAPPRGRARAGWGLWYNSGYFLALGVWAVAGSWHRYRTLGIVAGFLYLQLTLAAFRVARLSGAVMYEQELARRIAGALVEVCRAARCVVPKVVVRDDAIRAAAVRRRRHAVSLVISRPFVDRVDDRELRALLAHEVIHIARDDFAAIRRRAWVSAAVVVLTCVVVGVLSQGKVITPVYLGFGLLAGILANTALSPFNRRLERRADLEGARLCGDPAALASALTVAHTLSTEARRRIYGPKPWRWILSPLSWTLPTHPPFAERVATLTRSTSARES